jgi:hypothetical protein
MDDRQSGRWWFKPADPQQAAGLGTRSRGRSEEHEPNGYPPAGFAIAADQQPAAPESGALPSISLPEGGAAIRGIDEKLSVDQPTGSARISAPVYTSPARQGFGPQLALFYDSEAGNGPLGLGWSIPVASITRKTSLGLPQSEDAVDSDVFVLAGAEDLVPLLEEAEDGGWSPVEFIATTNAGALTVHRYRPRVEAAFSRIERWQDTTSGDVHWRTVSKDNVTDLYGQTPRARSSTPTIRDACSAGCST